MVGAAAAAAAAVGDVYCRELWGGVDGQRLSRLSVDCEFRRCMGACGVAAGVAAEGVLCAGDCEGGLSPGGLGVGGGPDRSD